MYPLITLFGGAAAVSQSQKRGVSVLAQFDDVRAVGPLVDSLKYQDRTVTKTAEAALTRVLPKLRASDAEMLNDNQRDALTGYLRLEKCAKQKALILAILKAYEQVGDGRALPFVRNLAAPDPAWMAFRAVTLAARECLPYLEARAEKERQAQTLLRAVENPVSDSEILLRPASGVSSLDQELLLRPASITEDVNEHLNTQMMPD